MQVMALLAYLLFANSTVLLAPGFRAGEGVMITGEPFGDMAGRRSAGLENGAFSGRQELEERVMITGKRIMGVGYILEWPSYNGIEGDDCKFDFLVMG